MVKFPCAQGLSSVMNSGSVFINGTWVTDFDKVIMRIVWEAQKYRENLSIDNDDDGYCATSDCDDNNPAINPIAIEIPHNGIDEDCDGFDYFTSIQEFLSSNITIYPNPVDRNASNSLIHIQVSNSSGQLIVFNSIGQELKTIDIISQESSFQFEMSNWHCGIYFLKLVNTAGQQVLVKIEGYNSGTLGNNLFVDNINIQGVPIVGLPTASFNSSNPSICAGQTVSFSDQSTSNITAWNWSFQGGTPLISNQANPAVTYANAGSYSVTLQVTNASGTNTTTNSNYVVVNALPAVPTITQNGSTLTAQAVGVLTFQWFLNGVLIPGATLNIYVPTASGLYTVYITNEFGCGITGDPYEVNLTNAILETQTSLFEVYPNPANSQINVKVDAKLLGSIYTVYDNTGKVVLSGKINSENTVIELGNLSGGIYLFSAGESLKQTFKVIKE